jgi:hypothetical protein
LRDEEGELRDENKKIEQIRKKLWARDAMMNQLGLFRKKLWARDAMMN